MDVTSSTSFATTQSKAARTTSAALSAKAEDAATAKLADQKQALETLKQLPKTLSDTAKAHAKQRVEQIRQMLRQLKMLGGGDPKRLARVIAQMAKELAAAVKEYAAAGGGDTAGTAADAQSQTSDSAAGDGATGTTKTSEAVAGDGDKPAADNSQANQEQATTGQGDSKSTDPAGTNPASAYQKASEDLNKQLQQSPEEKDKADFLAEIRAIERKLKDALKTAKLALQASHQEKNKDTDAADDAFKALDKEMLSADSGPSLAGAVLNIST